MSAKRRKRMSEVRPIREGLIEKAGECMICGHSPRHPWRDKPRECSQLCCHEIANGPGRENALDKPYAILVLCWYCNGFEVEDNRRWPEARQLGLLKSRSPEDYDLTAYNAMVNPRAPNRITEEDVSRAFLPE